MSIHTVTEEITVTSEVEILAPPGANTETVIKLARKEVDRVRESIGLLETLPTNIYVSHPVYKEGRVWLVNIRVIHKSTTFVDLPE